MATPSLHPTSGTQWLRSTGAVLAGMVAGVVLSIGTDLLMYALGVLPQPGQPAGDNPLLLATAYRTVYGIAAAYLTARLAPNRPMGHALVLGAFGFIASAVGAVVTWNRQPSLGPHWYPVMLVVLALPTAWAGGKLRLRQLE